jgi:glycosyltransferase involved in cell wall biosynthesis
MTEVVLSIIIPNWNHEAFLARAVRSALAAVRVLERLDVDAEVLIMDDASRDGSQGLLRQIELRYCHEGVRVMLQRRNLGPSLTRNSALEEARGRFVFFLDADNEVVPESLPVLLRAIRETRAAIVYGNLLIRRPGQGRAVDLCSNDTIQPRLFQKNYVDTMALADRLQLLDLGGFQETLPHHEDWELWQHLISEGRLLVFVPIVVGLYYELPLSHLRVARNGDSVQATAKRVFNQNQFRIMIQARTYYRGYHPDVGELNSGPDDSAFLATSSERQPW